MKMRGALLPILVLTVIITISAAAQADVWIPEALPFNFASGSGLGFALDSTGTPGFSFRSTARFDDPAGLYYGYLSDDVWTSELIDGGTGTGAGSSLVYGGTTPHIAYGAGGASLNLHYATGMPGSWNTAKIADAHNPYHTDIALDRDGDLGVAWLNYQSLFDFTVNYACHDGATWSTPEHVADDPRGLSGVSLLLPETVDRPGILYTDGSGGLWSGPPALIARDPHTGEWHTAPDTGLTGFEDVAWMSAAFNRNRNNIAMCYMDMWTGDLTYAEFDGTWSTEIIAELETPHGGLPDMSYIDVAADDWGNVHLLYYNPDNERVEYRYRHADGGWAKPLTIHDQTNASWMRLAIDDHQNPWFAYYGQTGDEGSLYLGQGNAVPEPATTALLGIGILSLIGFGRRNRKTAARGQS